MKPTYGVATVALAVVTAVTSCGQPAEGPHAGHGGSAITQGASSAQHNAADVTFARNMIPHHQQGVFLAAMVPAHTQNPDLRVIAAHIAADQQAEIQTLNKLLAQWNEHADHDHGPGAGHDGMAMAGMVDDATITRLQSLNDAAFDTLWARSMIGHHQGAITMAQDEIAHGQSADAIHTARLIVEAQQREIAIMTHLISAAE
ncbi:protein of unknown function DUF305 [Mycolicibacterium rhodesiae JS60]|nr:protein of unknown function DUF305 [Mycolicibacterium rhodesiae JS60]